MSAFEKFWASNPARTTIRAAGRFVSKCFHEATWRWAKQEGAVRRELLAKSKLCNNPKLLEKIVLQTHDLFLLLLNERHGGLALEEYVSQLSPHSFSQLYTIVMTLFCFRIGQSGNHLREDLATICREPDIIEHIWNILTQQCADENEQARQVWDECVIVLGSNSAVKLSFFKGIFVIMTNRMANEIKGTAE